MDNTTGNYHLTGSSPCIGAGSDNDTQPGWRDMDGQPRICGLHVDIGADEYYIPGDANGDAAVTFEDFSALQNNYGQSGKAWPDGDFNGDGMVTFEDFSILENHDGQIMGAGEAPAAGAEVAGIYGGTGCLAVGAVLLGAMGMGMAWSVERRAWSVGRQA